MNQVMPRLAMALTCLVGVSLGASGCAAGPAITASAALVPYAGSSWRLVTVARGSETHDVPGSILATADFSVDGQVLLSDSTNAIFGRYSASDSGFTTAGTGSSAVAYAGNNETKILVMLAVDAVAESRPVGATVDGDRLVLTIDNYVMTFTRTGPAADMRPTATPSVPGSVTATPTP